MLKIITKPIGLLLDGLLRLTKTVLNPGLTKTTMTHTTNAAGKVVATTAKSVTDWHAVAGLAAIGAIGAGGVYVANNTDLLNSVQIPSQYQGQAPAAPTSYSRTGDKQTFANIAPAAPTQPTRRREEPILKRTQQAINEGRFDAPAQVQPPAPQSQRFANISAAPAPVAPPRGPTLESLMTEYERAFADSMQVMMGDPSKKDQMDREKAKIFDQIAAIVFPQPKSKPNKEAMDYIQSRQNEDPRAVADLLQSIQFLEEAGREQK